MTETPHTDDALALGGATPLRREVPNRPGARVEVRNMFKQYEHGGRTLRVLDDVTFTLDAGEMVAIMGASGVGKSTLLQVLGTLDLPSAGLVRIAGEEITRMTQARLAEFRNREIGFVFQFHHLLPEFTALENVMMPALIQRQSRAAARRRAADVLGRVGLSQRLTHKPAELSGGEQQRVALARALVLEPSLLLADEPTGNLDRRTGEEIHELFIELNRERGSTLLVVTHNPELAHMLPRCLHMIDGGTLVEEPPDVESAGHESGGHEPAADEPATDAVSADESAADEPPAGDDAPRDEGGVA